MQFDQEAVIDTGRRIQRFLDDNTALLDAVNQSTARKRLDETVAQLATHAVVQVAGRRTAQGETAKQRALREALRSDYMQPIAVIASQKLREQPEFETLRMPPWNMRGERLAAVAKDMADAAEKYTDLFVQEGLQPDFVAQLRAATDRLDESIGTRGQSQGQQVGATKGLREVAKRARGLFQVLDAQVRPKLGTNDDLLRQWQLAIHVQRARKPVSTTSGTGSSAAATPSSTAAPAVPSSTAPSAAPSTPSDSAPTATA